MARQLKSDFSCHVRTLKYLKLAGRRTAALNADAEAIAMLKRALKVAIELGDVPAEHRLMNVLDQLAAAGVGAT